MRIWIVEDEKELAEEYARILTEAGHDVRTFINGRTVLRAFLDEHPNGILTDFRLGDWTGDKIVAVAQGQHVQHVALMSGLPAHCVPVAEGVHFFLKPIDPNELVQFFSEEGKHVTT